MKQITIDLYNYDELTDKAKERALDKWNEHNDDPYMQSHMINLLKEELEARGIKYDTDSIDVYYSLGYCQGDGFMFEGILDWRDYRVNIKHSGHYYHSNSYSATWYSLDGEEVDPKREDELDFKTMYSEVCAKMERAGYDHIEYQRSEENFRETCDANEYTFEADGTMRNVTN